jgi:hypothetical protein
MSNRTEILEIIEDLQRLKIRENALLTRLALVTSETSDSPALSAATPTADTPAAPTPNSNSSQSQSETSRFRIGETVTIRNPCRHQPSTGKVVKIGPSWITIQPRKGKPIRRAPHNLIQQFCHQH